MESNSLQCLSTVYFGWPMKTSQVLQKWYPPLSYTHTHVCVCVLHELWVRDPRDDLHLRYRIPRRLPRLERCHMKNMPPFDFKAFIHSGTFLSLEPAPWCFLWGCSPFKSPWKYCNSIQMEGRRNSGDDTQQQVAKNLSLTTSWIFSGNLFFLYLNFPLLIYFQWKPQILCGSGPVTLLFNQTDVWICSA